MPNSRSTPMPMSSTENTCAQGELFTVLRPMTAPMKKVVTTTIGMASRPARSAMLKVGAQRIRRGKAIVRAITINRWPVKAMAELDLGRAGGQVDRHAVLCEASSGSPTASMPLVKVSGV